MRIGGRKVSNVAIAILLGIPAASFLAMFGVMNAFVLRTVPLSQSTNDRTLAGLRSNDDTGRKLKESMIGLMVVAVAPLIVLGGVLANLSHGSVKVEIPLVLVTAVAAMFVVVLSLVYTQDRRVIGEGQEAPNKKLKDGVLAGLVSASVVTVALGLASGLYLITHKDQLLKDAKFSVTQIAPPAALPAPVPLPK